MAGILYDMTVAPLTPCYLSACRANRLVNHDCVSSQSESALVSWRANFFRLIYSASFRFSLYQSLFYSNLFFNRLSS